MQHPVFYVAAITADHAFGDSVAGNAFASFKNAKEWAEGWIADQLKTDRLNDPSFDDYGYSFRITEWTLQDV